jgi:hypothetical protein
MIGCCNKEKRINLRYPNKDETNLDLRDVYIVKKRSICSSLFCGKTYGLYTEHYEHIYEIIRQMNIDTFKKRIIIARFINLIKSINSQVCTVCYTYNFMKFFQQTGSIIIPSILSIQGATGGNSSFHTGMYWGTWGLSLTIGLLTNWIQLFKLDKKFILYSSIQSKLEQEFWLYISLTGRYGNPITIIRKDGSIKIKKSTHKDKIDVFLQRIEELYKKLSDDEEDILLETVNDKEHKEDDDDDEDDDEDSVELEQKNVGTQMTFIGDTEVDNIIESEIELSEMKEQVILTFSDDIDDETNGNDENDDKIIVTVIDPEDQV